jgi:hypothetical protein
MAKDIDDSVRDSAVLKNKRMYPNGSYGLFYLPVDKKRVTHLHMQSHLVYYEVIPA